jgi:ribosomal protein S18 acetylase RimI-like enzyme
LVIFDGAVPATIWNNEIVQEGRQEVLLIQNHFDPGQIMKIEKAQSEHVREIMDWFPDLESVNRWGSPYMRYPLREETFFEDIYWDRISSRIARYEDGRLLGFGQFYPKLGRCHLARLIINPVFRGRGQGEAFIGALMKHGSGHLDTAEFSLYVMTANKPAYNCYKNLGFSLATYPHGDPHLENCVFMIADHSVS